MKRNTIVQYALITVACLAYAFGFDWCYDANHISVGGFPVSPRSSTSSCPGRRWVPWRGC